MQIGTAGPKAPEKENDSWRSSTAPGAATGDNTPASRASGAAARAAAAAAAANPRGPPPPEASIIQKAEDLGRQKWAPAKDLTSNAQAQQKLRGLLNKLTPDNFDRLTPQVPPPLCASARYGCYTSLQPRRAVHCQAVLFDTILTMKLSSPCTTTCIALMQAPDLLCIHPRERCYGSEISSAVAPPVPTHLPVNTRRRSLIPLGRPHAAAVVMSPPRLLSGY